MNPLFGPRVLVHVGDGFRASILADDDLASHRAGDQGESPGLLRGRNHYLAGTEIGSADAPSAALPAVVAGGPSVMLLRDDGEPRRTAGDIQFVARLLYDRFRTARLRRRKENAIGSAGHVLFRPEHADIGFDFVVIGSDVVVADRPVISHPVVRTRFEVNRREAQR